MSDSRLGSLPGAVVLLAASTEDVAAITAGTSLLAAAALGAVTVYTTNIEEVAPRFIGLTARLRVRLGGSDPITISVATASRSLSDMQAIVVWVKYGRYGPDATLDLSKAAYERLTQAAQSFYQAAVARAGAREQSVDMSSAWSSGSEVDTCCRRPRVLAGSAVCRQIIGRISLCGASWIRGQGDFEDFSRSPFSRGVRPLFELAVLGSS